MSLTLRLQRTGIEPVLAAALQKCGFSDSRAALCARLFTETSLDGVYSHGLNRFPLFIDSVNKGFVRPDCEPSLVRAANNFETWDGNLGPGNLNAWTCMGRAVELAGEHGMGAVALRNTNHWMRGGTYGLQAARAGCIGICMTNTKPNMPPWGGREAAVGNNPFVIGAPNEPYPFLLDMAMSQFSYGKMEVLEQRCEQLPFPGGFDSDLELSSEPRAILDSELALPMGYWKGSGLALMIDLLVSLLSGGLTTPEIGQREEEYGVSQLFLAFDLQSLGDHGDHARVVRELERSLLDTAAMEEGGQVFYPGQRTGQRRQENERDGIPVERETWNKIKAL
jgi:3-dehydro-L-gulonate 2-dehydrogenase